MRDLPDIVQASRFHRVAGCVLQSLRHLDLPAGGALAELQSTYYTGIQRHLKARAELASMALTLDAADIRWMSLKGPVLAEVVYRRADLRAYGDIDLLVMPTDLGPCIEALEAAGCRVVDRNWTLLCERMLGQVQLITPGGTPVDLHWHLLNEARLRDRFTIDTGLLFEQARTVHVGAAHVRTLSPSHTLLHLAIHAAMAGGNRLVWMKDLEQALRNDAPPWSELLEDAARWRASLVCATMLQRARTVLGVPVPDQVLEALAPGRVWINMARIADLVAPVARSTGRRSLARLVARATGVDDRSSVLQLASKVRAGLHVRPQITVAPTPTADGSDPQSTQHPAGGASERARFIQLVHATQ